MSAIIKIEVEPFHFVIDTQMEGLLSRLNLVEVKPTSYINRKIKKTYWPDAHGGYHLDHINRNPFDYRLENLRLTSVQENMSNRKYGETNGAKIHYRVIGETEVWKELFC